MELRHAHAWIWRTGGLIGLIVVAFLLNRWLGAAWYSVCAFLVAAFLLLLAIPEWRKNVVVERRVRAGECEVCGHNRVNLAPQITCPKCGASATVSAPTPAQNFPYFIQIGDTKGFVRADSQGDFNQFEENDVDGDVYLAWDAKGRKYKLVWTWTMGVCPDLVAEDGIADFRAEVSEYKKRLAADGTDATRYGLCKPDTLLAALNEMEQAKV